MTAPSPKQQHHHQHNSKNNKLVPRCLKQQTRHGQQNHSNSNTATTYVETI
jgi:hypothetical protein